MSQVEDTITKLESLRRIAGALHRDIEGLLEGLKQQPRALSEAEEKGYRAWSAITGDYSIEAFLNALTEAGNSIGAVCDIARSRNPGALQDSPLASTQAPVVDLPYVQDPVSPTGQVRDAFHSAKAPIEDPKRINFETPRSQINPVRREPAVIHQAGRQPQPIGEAVEELLHAVEANVASQRGPQSPGEVLTKYMSPAILRGGRGFVQPGASGLKRYRESLFNNGGVEPDQLVNFPTGFYSADQTGQDEFFIATPNFFVLVYGLRGEVGLGVHLRSSVGNMITQDEMSAGERLQLSKELDVVLSSLPE